MNSASGDDPVSQERSGGGQAGRIAGLVAWAAVVVPQAAAAAAPAAAIRVDQVGYPTAAAKLAILVADPPASRFTIHRVVDGAEVHAGALSAPVADADSGDRVQIADFGELLAPGRYEVRVEDVGHSLPFAVAADPYRDLLRTSLRAFHGQRCGVAVDLGDGYRYAACHRAAAFHPSSGRRGETTLTGGWHDAGDYGRYVVNSAIATATLLWSWELYGDRLRDLDLGIPESGDAVPDLLDEVRWNLEWMLAMQDADGGVWHKQTAAAFPGFVLPHADTGPSLVIGTGAAPWKSSCATADLAAVAAIAGRAYRPFDTSFAARALGAARRAWRWLEAHPEVSFRNPPGITTGEYGDDDCGDERLWAAAELWRTAEDRAAGTYFTAHADAAVAAVTATDPPSWPRVGALAAWTHALGADGAAPSATVAAVRRRSRDAAGEIVARMARHPYRIPLTAEDWVWGSNAVAANYGLQLLVAHALDPDARFVAAATEILHYLLGRNPFAVSFVTGVGGRAVRHPHHRPSGADTVAAPWPGLLVGGPNRHRQDPVLRALPPATPPARAWADVEASYAGNEVAINWNAPLVTLVAGVADQFGSRDEEGRLLPRRRRQDAAAAALEEHQP